MLLACSPGSATAGCTAAQPVNIKNAEHAKTRVLIEARRRACLPRLGCPVLEATATKRLISAVDSFVGGNFDSVS